MNIPEAETCASRSRPCHRQIVRRPQARRNPNGKIYFMYIFCALVITDPVYMLAISFYADISLFLRIYISEMMRR